MTSNYQLVPTVDEHLIYLANNMRQCDRDEIQAATNKPPLEGLRSSFDISRETMTGLADGEVVVVFGCGEPSPFATVGIPWLLATDKLDKHIKILLRMTPQYIEAMRKEYRFLCNYVDARNTKAIRLLKRLGFDVTDEPHIINNGVGFKLFTMEGHNYV